MKLTTTRLTLPTMPRVRLDLPTPVTAAICTFAAIAIAFLVGQIRSAQPAKVDPIIIIATPRQQAAPTAIPQAVAFQQQPAPAAPVRQVVAFAAPDGDILGPIAAPDLGAIVARFGDGWVATMHDGGMVWIRISELGGSLANVAPPAPQIQPAIAPVPPAPVVEQPSYQVTNSDPPPAPEPTAAPESAPAVVAAPVQAPAAAPAQDFQPHNPPTDVELVWVTTELCMEKGGSWCQK